MQSQDAFRAMNTGIDVVIDGPAPPLDCFLNIRLLFERQEERFSRFRPSSLLSRLNRGEAIADPQFALACRLALEAHDFTGGLFNPMVLPALADAGYSASFEHVRGGNPVARPVPDPRHALRLNAGNEVRLTHGQLDLGGIVKGWTVDLAVEAFQPQYANLLLNAGGDLRCAGAEDGADGWLLAVEGRDALQIWQGEMRGALATSTTRKRRWLTDAGETAHHLIDPRDGLPAASPYEQVSVWADQTWNAECWAKAILIGGDDAANAAASAGLRFVTVSTNGQVAWSAAPPTVKPTGR
jgi:thiamine biosynthesis lipoprotein